jgi:putative chitinase
MTIDVPRLLACGVRPTQAKLFAPHLDKAFKRFDIRTNLQQAAFIAQAMHESANFTHLEESLYYKTPQAIFNAYRRLQPLGLGTLASYCRKPKELANLAYANINGNGDVSSGDGWRYRGRGLFQLTGRAIYMAAGDAAGRPYKDHPELVLQPEDAVMTAGWYWATTGCNKMAEQGEFDRTTRRINGGNNGEVERRALYAAAQEALSHVSIV